MLIDIFGALLANGVGIKRSHRGRAVLGDGDDLGLNAAGGVERLRFWGGWGAALGVAVRGVGLRHFLSILLIEKLVCRSALAECL